MWMKRSAAIGQGTQRNFLRENKLLVRQTPMMTLRRLEREPERQPQPQRQRQRQWERESEQAHWHWPAPSYEQPTAASRARRSGTLPLAETQRRLMNGDRQGRQAFCGGGGGGGGQQSEKQIQTEDISDEQFLNAALLKCTEQGHGQGQARFMRGCSEGDELPVAASGCTGYDEAGCLRRTASNFELGRLLAMKRTPNRPPGGCPITQPAQLDQAESGTQPPLLKKSAKMDAEANAKCASVCARASLPHVLQLAMPDVTDVEQEPQLDQSLSARTNASCRSQESNRAEASPAAAAAVAAVAAAAAPAPENAAAANKRQLNEDQVLLTEAQRIGLLEAAQARHRQLIWEYNRLPISMGTLRVRNLKIQLEQQLDLLDSDLSVLNLPQVYIRRDQLQQISSISC